MLSTAVPSARLCSITISCAQAHNGDNSLRLAAEAHGAAHGALLQDHLLRPLPADYSQAACNLAIQKSLMIPELQVAAALQEPPCSQTAGLPGTITAAIHGQTEMLGHNQMRSPQNWSETQQLAQHKVATSGGGQQPWITGLHKHRAGTARLPATGQLAKGLAPRCAAGLSATQQEPSSMAGQPAGEALGSSPERLPQSAKQQHIAAAQTQSVAALQRAADTVPSWAETTLPDHSGSPHRHGFLASSIMLETLSRQKQKQVLSLHASCDSPPEEKGAMDPEQNETLRQGSGQGGVGPDPGLRASTPRSGQAGFSPELPTSHK